MSRLIPAPTFDIIKISSTEVDSDIAYQVEVNLSLIDTVDSLGVNTELFQFVKGPATDFAEGRKAPDLTDYMILRIVQILSPVATDYLINNFDAMAAIGFFGWMITDDLGDLQAVLTDAEPQSGDYEGGEDSAEYQLDHNMWQAQWDQVAEGKWYDFQDISLNQNRFDGIDKFYDKVLSEGIDAPGPGRNKSYRVPYQAKFEIDGEYMEGHITYFAVCCIDMQKIARDFGLGPAAMASSIFETIYGDGTYMVALDNYVASSGTTDASAPLDTGMPFFLTDTAYDADDCSHFKLYLTSTESYTNETIGIGVPWTSEDGVETFDSYEHTYNGLHMRGTVFFDLMRMARFESPAGFLLGSEIFRQTVMSEELIQLEEIKIYRRSSEGGGAPGEFPLIETLYADMIYEDNELVTVNYYLHDDLFIPFAASTGNGAGFIGEIGELLGFSQGNHYPLEVISFLDIGKDVGANTVESSTSFSSGMVAAQWNGGCSDFLAVTAQSIEYKVCVTFKDEMVQFLIDLYTDIGSILRILERYYHDSLLPCHYHEYTDEFNEIFVEFVASHYGPSFLVGDDGGPGLSDRTLINIIYEAYVLKNYLIGWGVTTGDTSTFITDWFTKMNPTYSTASPEYILDFINHVQTLLLLLKNIIDSAGYLDDLGDAFTDDSVDVSTAFTNQVEVCCTFSDDAYTYTEDDGTIDPFFGSGFSGDPIYSHTPELGNVITTAPDLSPLDQADLYGILDTIKPRY